MIHSYNFLQSVLDTISDHIVVINNVGEIVYVNRSWISYGQDNAHVTNFTWEGVNYLKECDTAAVMGDDFGIHAASGIRSVINGDEENFYLEYPCHSPDEKRWFMMQVAPLVTQQGAKCFVISHKDISERKIAEETVLNSSRFDGLTGIPNRRYFDDFLEDEWKRCSRLGLPISLMMIDLDYFKLINDTYGHQAGDQCLNVVGNLLKKLSIRPSDLCARYGGEEFSIVYGNTTRDQASKLAYKLLDEIRALKIPNENAPTLPILTASIGLATMYSDNENSVTELIKQADESLYAAKRKGRNQLYFSEINQP
jgi:diguanylate cyclase (GGDEF)-like protein